MNQSQLPAEWYALTVKPRHERTAVRNLQAKGWEGFSPLYRVRRRWCDRIKELETPLFPGYVFCRFPSDSRLQVMTTPSVTSVVGFGRNPAPVGAEEIAALKSIVASRLPAQPWPYLRVGQKVRIEQGCLEGVRGVLLREKDLCRVVVSVEILQRSVAVEIDRSQLSLLREAA